MESLCPLIRLRICVVLVLLIKFNLVKTEPNFSQSHKICENRVSCKTYVGKITYPTIDNYEDICYCDNLCQGMKDCCYDYSSYNITNETSADEINATWSCVKFGTILPVWMKKNCSKTWTNVEIASQCHNAPQSLNSTTYPGFIPVVGVNNVTYRNQFCAMCNNQKEFDFWKLDIDFYPSTAKNLGELIDYFVSRYGESINDRITPKHKKHSRRYCLNVTSKCKIHEPSKVVDECLFGKVGITQMDEELYKNAACALCNNVNETELKCGPKSKSGSGSGLETYDFFIIINFKNSKQTRLTASSSCKSGVFDNHLKTCIDNDQLVPPQKSPLDKYKIAIWLKTLMKIQRSNVTRDFISKFIYDVSTSNIHKVQLEKIQSPYVITFEVNLTLSQTIDSLKNVSTSHKQRSETYSIKKFIQPFSGVFYIHYKAWRIEVVKTTYRRLACFGLKTYNKSEYVEIDEKIFINKTSKYYARDEYFKESSDNGNIKVCEYQLPSDCDGKRFKYNRSEFEIKKEDLSAYHKIDKILYSYDEYSIKGDLIIVCRKLHESGNSVRALLSLIAISMSLVCLVLVLITYSIFTQLRTPPGKNLMNLTLALLIFSVLWLLRGEAQKSRPLCITMAFTQPYVILVSFTSMAKIAHDTMKMFTDPIGHQRRGNSSFVKFLIIWLIPVLHVGVIITLWKYRFLTVNDQECWLTGTYEYIVIFVPLCISMFYNILCFTRSIVEMRKLEKSGQMLRAQKQEKSSLFIYIKIAILLGLGWSCSFFALLIPVFTYVYVIFTAFQGAYIFLAFVCNKNVLMLYKRRFNKQPDTRHTLSMSNSLCRSFTVRDKLENVEMAKI